jgi:hypothetical protein
LGKDQDLEMPSTLTRAQKLRVVYVLLAAISVAFYLFEELYLRRWLYHHYGHGSVVAGSLPNFLAVLLLGLAAAVLRLPDSNFDAVRLSVAIMAGLILYEIAQIWMPHQVFDWNDIVATLLGGGALWTVLRGTSVWVVRRYVGASNAAN